MITQTEARASMTPEEQRAEDIFEMQHTVQFGSVYVAFDPDGEVHCWSPWWENEEIPEVNEIIIRNLSLIPSTIRKIMGLKQESDIERTWIIPSDADDMEWSFVIFQLDSNGLNTLDGNHHGLRSVKEAMRACQNELLDWINWKNKCGVVI